MVVIVILGILAGLIVPKIMVVPKKQNSWKAKMQMKAWKRH
jgi:type II secretory pathway pseudopilin PulG